MSRDDAQMKIRLPADLKEKLEKAATDNKRSMNAEVLQRLSESFESEVLMSTEITGVGMPDLMKYIEMLKENTMVLKELTLTIDKKKKDGRDN